jgi:hypothetical protein
VQVTRWPGQENSTGDAKVSDILVSDLISNSLSSQIPTLVAYQNRSAKFFGVEAAECLGDEDYEVAQWFKVRAPEKRNMNIQ